MAVGIGDPEIVGREKELADIAEAVRDLDAGAGGFRAYLADPGLGKTVMLLALSKALREAGLAALWGRGKKLEDLIDFALTRHRLGQPAAVLFDDLHGLDAGAVQAADRLLEMTSGPLLFAVAYRPRQLPLPLTAIFSSTQARLGARHLAPLTLEETGRLIGPRPDLEAIHHQSEGVPLYAHVLADAAHPGAAQLFAELAALPPDDLATAQAAAVLDGPFLPETLLAVSELDPRTTRSSLDSLASADIIRAPRSGPLLALRHKTLATVAYRTTTISQRHRLHLRADRELERSGAPAIARAAHVANSFDPAHPGHPDRHRTLALGAQQALTTDPASANTWLEAVDARLTHDHPHWPQIQLLLAKARLHMGRLDDSRATFLKLGTGSAPEEADAALQTGRIERLLGRYPEASALIRTGMTAASSVAARGVGLSELSAIAADCSRYSEADRLATEAIHIARSIGDRLQECSALASAAWARTAAGDVAGGAMAAAAAGRLIDAMLDSVAVQDIDCLRLLGQSELLLGRLTDSQRHIVRGVRLARRTGQRHVLPNLLKVLAELELRLGRLDRASEVLDEAEPLAAESGAIAIHTLITSLRASTLMWQHPSARADEAVAAAERATGYAANANKSLAWPLQAQLALGEALIFAGQPGHGGRVMLTAGGGAALPRVSQLRRVRWWEILTIAAVADRDLARADEYATLAVEAVNRAPTDLRRGYAYRARALVDSAQGATASALEAGETAAAAFTAAAASLDLGRTQVIIASTATDAGLLDDAGELLDMAGALARRCGSERLREQVETQLARLSPQAPPRDWQATLTRRERDIALLAGQALASTAIAAQLHLSVRTVDSHLGRIYRKLGVANRVALANLLSRP